MFEPNALLPFIVAVFVIVIVPGPTVTVIIANSLRKGAMAGIMNVLGTQAGLVPMVLIVAYGLDTVVTVLGHAFFWVKLAGAAYLVWLGINLLLSDGQMGKAKGTEMSLTGYFMQGVFVIWSNPKALLFFGAFIPQFVNPTTGDPFWQALLLGSIFMLVATLCDGAYAILAGKAGQLLTRARVRLVEIGSGLCLVFGGVWLAFQRSS